MNRKLAGVFTCKVKLWRRRAGSSLHLAGVEPLLCSVQHCTLRRFCSSMECCFCITVHALGESAPITVKCIVLLRCAEGRRRPRLSLQIRGF